MTHRFKTLKESSVLFCWQETNFSCTDNCKTFYLDMTSPFNRLCRNLWRHQTSSHYSVGHVYTRLRFTTCRSMNVLIGVCLEYYDLFLPRSSSAWELRWSDVRAANYHCVTQSLHTYTWSGPLIKQIGRSSNHSPPLPAPSGRHAVTAVLSQSSLYLFIPSTSPSQGRFEFHGLIGI